MSGNSRGRKGRQYLKRTKRKEKRRKSEGRKEVGRDGRIRLIYTRLRYYRYILHTTRYRYINEANNRRKEEEKRALTRLIDTITRHTLQSLPRATEGSILVVISWDLDKSTQRLCTCDRKVSDELWSSRWSLFRV